MKSGSTSAVVDVLETAGIGVVSVRTDYSGLPVLIRSWEYPDGTSSGHAVVNPAGNRQTPATGGEKSADDGLAAWLGVSRVVVAGRDCPLLVNLRDRENRERAARRARRTIERRVRSGNLTRLLTFTNGGTCGGWLDHHAALDDVMRFLKVHAVGLKLYVPMVVVAERGGLGGRWHVHALIPPGTFLPYRRIIAAWSNFLTRRGFVSRSGKHRFHAGDIGGEHRDGFANARVAAAYAVKYLSKSLTEAKRRKGCHSYRTQAQSVPRPREGRCRSLREAMGLLRGRYWFFGADGVDYGFAFDTAPPLRR